MHVSFAHLVSQKVPHMNSFCVGHLQQFSKLLPLQQKRKTATEHAHTWILPKIWMQRSCNKKRRASRACVKIWIQNPHQKFVHAWISSFFSCKISAKRCTEHAQWRFSLLLKWQEIGNLSCIKEMFTENGRWPDTVLNSTVGAFGQLLDRPLIENKG